MLTTGNILMPQMRNPVASSNKPPTALKSAIIDGVVSGKISAAAHASVNWMISNGILITDTAGAKQDNNRDIILNKRFMRWLLT